MDIDESKLVEIFINFPSVIDDRIKFVGILRDYFPMQKLSCNAIIMAYDLGIVSEIKNNNLNEYFIARFTKKMVNEYGIQSQIAQESIVTWCETYGRIILSKELIISRDSSDNCGYTRENDDFEIINDVLVKYNGKNVDVAIPEGVKEIGKKAFMDCDFITSVKIPNGVKSIGYCAFYQCKSLKNIIMPNSVTFLDHSSFAGCSILSNVILSENLTAIGESVFQYCVAIKSIKIPSSVKSIDWMAFYGCTSLTNIIIEEGVISFGNYLFGNCTALKKIIIPNSVTAIGYGVFDNCISLESIVIPSSVVSVDGKIFNNCENLQTIYCRLDKPVTGVPGGWDTNWLGLCRAEIIWGYRGNETEQRNIHEEECLQTENVTRDLLSIGDYKDIGGGYITFGTYPQSRKAENIRIGELYDSERGYYLGSDDCLYEKYQGDYYKIEPIKWKILSLDKDLFIVADNILYALRFGAGNNYAKSDIRAWLNGEFYDKAFNTSQKCSILTTIVDNSLSSTGDAYNRYVCENTKDKVFLLSRKEVEKYIHDSRKRTPTEYAVAKGVSQSNTDKRNGKACCGEWWLRSPSSSSVYPNYAVQVIYYNGSFSSLRYYYSNIGLIPALKLNVIGQDFAGQQSKNIQEFDIQNDILIKYNGDKTNVVIPDGVKGIGDSAFGNCRSLKNITIPDSVTYIGKFAFYYCVSLRSIIIPKSVNFIGSNAFLSCENLIAIYCRIKKPMLGLPKRWDENWLGYGFYRCKAKVIWNYKV